MITLYFYDAIEGLAQLDNQLVSITSRQSRWKTLKTSLKFIFVGRCSTFTLKEKRCDSPS